MENKEVSIKEFKTRMSGMYPADGPYEKEEAHMGTDALMVETLKSLGYDLSDYEAIEKWYA